MPGPQLGAQHPGIDTPVTPDGQIVAQSRHQPAESHDYSRDFALGAQAVGRGVADIAGLPVDLTAAGLNLGAAGFDQVARLLGGSFPHRIENPILGNEHIADTASRAAETAGVPVAERQDMTDRQRFIYDAERFGSQAVVGSSLLNVVRAALADAAVQAPAIIRTASDAPRAYVGDAAAGLGAGAGTNLYDEHAPEGLKEAAGPVGPMVAAILGGGLAVGAKTAAEAAGGLGVRTAENILGLNRDPAAPVNSATGAPFTRAEMDRAAKTAQRNAANPDVAAPNIRDAVRERSSFASPGEMPTTGLLSNDPGLSALNKAMRSKEPTPFVARDRAVNSRAAEIAGGVAPKGAKARDFTDFADRAQADRVSGARLALGEAQRQADDVANGLRSAGRQVEAYRGQGIPASQALDKAIVEGGLKSAQATKNAAFAAIDPAREVVRPIDEIAAASAKVRASLGRLNDPNSVLPTGLLDRIDALAKREIATSQLTGLLDASGSPVMRDVVTNTGGEGTITFGELNAIRPEIAAGILKARRAGDYPLADNLRTMQQAIDAETSRLAAEASPAGQRAAAAMGGYNRDFRPFWNAGPGDAATQFRNDFNLDRTGRTTTPPSQTASRFLQPGAPEKAASLQRVMSAASDPQAAADAARRFLLADMAESGLVDARSGQVRYDMLHKWRNQRWGDVLDRVPGFRQEVDGLLKNVGDRTKRQGQLADEVRKASAALDEAQRAKGALGLVLGHDPVRAVGAVFGSADPEKSTSQLVKLTQDNPAAHDGLKASVRDYLIQRATTPDPQATLERVRPVDFAKLDNLFASQAKTLAKVFSPEEMHALRQTHKLLEPLRNLKLSPHGPGADEEAIRAWHLLEGGLKAKYGVLKGGGIVRTLKIVAEAFPSRADATREIMLRMMFDPDLAVHLLARRIAPASPAWNGRLMRLLGYGAGVRAEAGGS